MVKDNKFTNDLKINGKNNRLKRQSMFSMTDFPRLHAKITNIFKQMIKFSL